MVCSQNRRCHRSYSALALRVIGTPAATRDRVKKLLIRRHRPEKSASSTGRGTNRVQMVGENDYRIDCERTFAPRYPKCGTQGSNVLDEGRRIPIGKRRRMFRPERSYVGNGPWPSLPRIPLTSSRATEGCPGLRDHAALPRDLSIRATGCAFSPAWSAGLPAQCEEPTGAPDCGIGRAFGAPNGFIRATVRGLRRSPSDPACCR